MGVKVEICRKAREEFGWEIPTRQLARIVYEKNKLAFNDYEDVRCRLRYIEGKKGLTQRKSIKTIHMETRPLNPYNLPTSYADDRKPFKLPLACDNILLISDLHIPYHNVKAISLAINYGVENNVNTIFINGDLMDFYKISRFQHDPRKRSIKEEFDACRLLLERLRDVFPKAEIYWLKGNHDMRYEHWLMSKCIEIFDDPYYQLENRLMLNDLRIKLLDDKVLVKIGKLNVTHGHHVFKGVFTPVNPARGAYMRAKKSVICGHLHRPSTHSEVDIDNGVTTCYTTGCLCELRPDYSPLVANSMHGFAHITTKKNGNYLVRNFQIIEGNIYNA
jgi:predicted phosphodiesterase